MPAVASFLNGVAVATCSLVLADTELHTIRAQAALVRSLLAELEELAPPRDSGALPPALVAQAAEELAQLACRMMTVAGSIAPDYVAELRLQEWLPQAWPAPSASSAASTTTCR